MISFTESSELYHSSHADGSGDIRNMIKSPALYRDAKAGLCDRETPALLFGIASHIRLLEPDAFASTVAIKPAKMSFATTVGKDWRDAHAGKEIVSFADAEHLQRMHDRMPSEVREIIAACRKEVTVRTTIDGLDVQCRPDLWQIETGRKHDLKTIDNIDLIERAIWDRRYDVQDLWYSDCIEAETKRAVTHSSLIFAEKRPPYRWRIVELDLDYQALARQAIDEAVAQIKARRKSGCWDDPAGLHDIASPPRWMESQIPAADAELVDA